MFCVNCRDRLISTELLASHVNNLESLEDSLIKKMFNPPEDVLQHYVRINNQKKIYMLCPVKMCPGKILIDTNSCTSCAKKICLACWEAMDTPKHTCLKSNVLTVKALMKQAKRCPFCTTLIIKTDGCNDMICGNCNLGFCWKTLSSKVVTNHHYRADKANAFYNFAGVLQSHYPTPLFVTSPTNFFYTYFTRLNKLRLSGADYETLNHAVCGFFTNDKTHKKTLFRLSLQIYILQRIHRLVRLTDHDDLLDALPKRFAWPCLSSLELVYDKRDKQWVFKDSIIKPYKWPIGIDCGKTPERQNQIAKCFYSGDDNDFVSYVRSILDSNVKTIICDNNQPLVKRLLAGIPNDLDITIIETSSMFKDTPWHETQRLTIRTDDNTEILNPRYEEYFKQGECLIISHISGYIPPFVFDIPNLRFFTTDQRGNLFMQLNEFMSYLDKQTFDKPLPEPQVVISNKILSLFNCSRLIYLKSTKNLSFLDFMRIYDITDIRYMIMSFEAAKKGLSLYQTFVAFENYLSSQLQQT